MWPDGVTGLDHTADVGIAVRAPTLEELFRRAAAGMVALVGGVEEGPADDRRPSSTRRGTGSSIVDRRSSMGPAIAASSAEPDVSGAAESATHRLELAAPDREALLVAWLREVLFLFQTRAFQYVDAHFEVLSDTRLVARLDGTAAEPVMELKGVTYHALAVRREDDGWLARVVFDV